MSGFEVAGLVLGAIPLIISTLQQYRGGVQTIQKWRKYDNELKCVIRNLGVERVKLQNICEKLLDGLVPPSRIDTMVAAPLGDLWLVTETQKKIRARLWGHWDLFEQTLRDMQMAIEEIKEKLGDGADVKWSDTSSIKRHIKRAGFTLSRSTYDDQLRTIQEGTTSLEKLTLSSMDLEPKRRVRSRVRLLNILRNVSFSLYRAVRSSLNCACSHMVSMRLSTWALDITPTDDEEDIIRELKFHLAVTRDSEESRTSDKWTEKKCWKELLVQANPLPPELAVSQVTLASVPNSMSKSSKKKVKAVSFMSSRSSSTTTVETKTSLVCSTVTSATLGAYGLSFPGSATPPSKSSTLTALDLCRNLKGATTTKLDCYGSIIDQMPPETRSYTVYPSEHLALDAENEWRMISLRDSLEGKQNRNPLTYRQKLQLAVSIASSVLQLHKTPWLAGIPSCSSIFFVQQSGFCLYDHAFVLAEHQNVDKASNSLPYIQCPTLLALGVLLIEIIRGQTIESLKIRDEVMDTAPKLLSDYMTARRLADEVYQGSSNYGSAVRRCINGEFSRQKLDLEDEDFRQEVYSSVVSLLEEDLRNA